MKVENSSSTDEDSLARLRPSTTVQARTRGREECRSHALAPERSASNSSLTSLPRELLVQVLSKLTPVELLSLGGCSRFCRRTVRDGEALWAGLCAAASFRPELAEPSRLLFERRALAEARWQRGNYRLVELRGLDQRLITGHMFFGEDGSRQVLTMDDDSRCLLWDIERGNCLGSAPVPDPSELLPSFAADASNWDCDSRHFLGVQNRDTIVIYGQGGVQLATCVGHTRPITCFGLLHALVEEKDAPAVCGEWSVAKHTTQALPPAALAESAVTLAISGSNDGTCRVWSVPDGDMLALIDTTGDDEVDEEGASRGGVLCMTLHQAACVGVAGTAGGALELFTLDQCRSLLAVTHSEGGLREPSRLRVRAHEGAVLCVEADWANNRIVTGSRDGTAKVWRVQQSQSCADSQKWPTDAPRVWAVAPEITLLVTLNPMLRPLANPATGGHVARGIPPPVRSIRVDNYGVLTVEGASVLLWDFGTERQSVMVISPATEPQAQLGLEPEPEPQIQPESEHDENCRVAVADSSHLMSAPFPPAFGNSSSDTDSDSDSDGEVLTAETLDAHVARLRRRRERKRLSEAFGL
eukprot:COSAG02_NODE_8239_length_2645_cov_11.536135_3_plen_583_part_01